jgi:ATP-dependent Clp protease ATP-binding subunit ClpC
MPSTGPLRGTLIRSRQEARKRGQPHGTERFLLGLTGGSDGVAVEALERLGITPDAVRQQVEQIAGQGGPRAPSGRIPGEPQARRFWHAVLDEALARGDDDLGTGHVLLALFSDSDAAAARALTRLGAGETQVRTVLAALVAESGPERCA